MKSLIKKNVVITGAASGIGREMAKSFAREKSNVAIIDVNEKPLKDTEEELSRYNVKVSRYKCNLASREEMEKTATKIKKDFDQIDIIVNNAGVISGKLIADLSYEEIKLTLDVNLMAVIWMTKQFMPEMMSRNDGHIVNVSSAAGLIATPKMGDYCAAKFGAVGFSDTLRQEFKKCGIDGVKVTIVCPSLINTGMFDGFKPPFLNPILEPEYVAERVIKAVKKDKEYLKLPVMVRAVNFMKLYPVAFSDFLSAKMGVTKAMDNFKGH